MLYLSVETCSKNFRFRLLCEVKDVLDDVYFAFKLLIEISEKVDDHVSSQSQTTSVGC